MEVQVPDKNILFQIKDLVEKQGDEVSGGLTRIAEIEKQNGVLTASQLEAREALKLQEGQLTNINARLDKLDAELPKGSKAYKSADGGDVKEQKRQEVGEMMVDLYRNARGLPEKYGFMSKIRAGQKEGDISGTGSGIDAAGGYLVPIDQAREIIRLVSNFGFARKYCRIMPMPREVMRIPTANYMPTTLINGSTIVPQGSAPTFNEGRTPTQTNQTFARPELVAARLMATDYISLEVDADSDPSLMAFLVDVFAEAVALAEDYQVLRGSLNPFTGVMNESGTGLVSMGASAGSASFKNVRYADLVDLYNAADEKAQDSGIFVMSAYAFNQIRKALVDGQGYPFFNPAQPIIDGVPLQIFGRPVVLSTVMPKSSEDTTNSKFIVYGDFKRYAIFGDRQSLAVDVSPHAAFTSGELVMRVMERFAFKAVHTGVFAVGKTA